MAYTGAVQTEVNVCDWAYIPKGLYQCTRGRTLIAVFNPTDDTIYIPPRKILVQVAPLRDQDVITGGVSVNQLEEWREFTLEEKEKFVKDILKLQTHPVLKHRPELHKRVVDIFVNNFEVLSTHAGECGKTDLVSMKIQVNPGAKPVRQNPRPMAPPMKKEFRQQLNSMLQEGIIEEANSPWASPIVPVRKKDGRTRFCVDYRNLNNVTIADAYPLTSIRSNLEALKGAKVFSVLDVASAYHHISVDPDSRDFTAFASPFGSFRYKRMPFGLKNAGSVYSRMVNRMLQQLPPGFCLSYLDDVLIYSGDVDSHVGHLEKVIQLHQQAGLKLQLNKTTLFQEEVEYLGHLVSKDGVAMLQEYVARIQEWPQPTTGKEMATWLGFCGYYRAFIPEFTNLTARMNGLKKEKLITWDADLEDKFKRLKAEFSAGRVQAFPDFESGGLFTLTTDWSSTGVGAILSQQQGDTDRFIAAYGRKCGKHEANYPSWKGEFLALTKTHRTLLPHPSRSAV